MVKSIRNRLEDEFNTSEEQNSFTAGKSGKDKLLTIRQLLKNSFIIIKDMHTIFIDLEKEYDSNPRKFLWNAMEIATISKPVINLVKLLTKLIYVR